MKLRNARNWAPKAGGRWALALGAFLLALIMRLWLHPYLDHRFPLIFFTAATFLVHFYFGLGPGLLIALPSLPVGIYMFVPPYMFFEIPTTDDLFTVSYYIVSTAVFMVLVQYLRRAQYEAVLISEIAQSRYLMLLDSEADRNAVEEELEALRR